MVNDLPASVGDTGSIRGSERSPGAGNGNPLQYSCLENPMEEEPGRLQSMGWQRVDSLERTLMLGGIGGRRRSGRQDEMAGWHHRLDGHGFE